MKTTTVTLEIMSELVEFAHKQAKSLEYEYVEDYLQCLVSQLILLELVEDLDPDRILDDDDGIPF